MRNKVAVVGSSTLDPSKYAGAIYAELLKLPAYVAIMLRRPRTGDPGAFEQFVARIAPRLGHEVHWMAVPEDAVGRSATYRRDIQMADTCEACLAFFDPARIMEGGTAHVVEKFADVGKAARALSFDSGGNVVRVGEYEAVY